jgi:hypothetical protein
MAQRPRVRDRDEGCVSILLAQSAARQIEDISRKGAKTQRKEVKRVFFVRLCVFAPLREMSSVLVSIIEA